MDIKSAQNYFNEENFPYEIYEIKDNNFSTHFISSQEVIQVLLTSSASEQAKIAKALQHMEITKGLRMRDQYFRQYVVKEMLVKKLGEQGFD